MTRSAKRWLAAIASASLMAVGLSAAATATAQAVPQQTGPFWPGNLLSMNNADFENGVGDWQVNSNISTLTTGTNSFLHNQSLKIVAAAAGTSIIQLSGTSGIQISVTGGATYRIGAYIKEEAKTGHTTEFDLGCYDSAGHWLGWVNGSAVGNNSTGAWQWVEDDIALPAACTYVQGSPRAQFTGMHSGGVIYLDEAWFAPARAALMIGAYAPSASVWKTDNTSIGPLQSIKTFFDSSTDFPSTWAGTLANPNICANVESEYTSQSQWPVCLIAFVKQESESQIQAFLTGMPTGQTVIFIYHQEPEGDSFSGSCGTGAAEFICEFETEAGYVRTAAANLGLTENVFTADDSASSQYDTPDSDDTGTAGYGCGWIVPSSYADVYLEDHYEHGWADGSSLPVQSGSTDGDAAQQWSNWLGCVSPTAKPIGLAEYGLCSGGNYCGPNDVGTCGELGSTTDDVNSMAADHTYLKSEPPNTPSTQPTLLWEYWYAKCWQFDNTNDAITEWQSIENENGGAVGG